MPVMGLEERKPLQGVRKKIAEKMTLSKQTIPHFTVMESASVEELIQLREKGKRDLSRRQNYLSGFYYENSYTTAS